MNNYYMSTTTLVLIMASQIAVGMALGWMLRKDREKERAEKAQKNSQVHINTKV